MLCWLLTLVDLRLDRDNALNKLYTFILTDDLLKSSKIHVPET